MSSLKAILISGRLYVEHLEMADQLHELARETVPRLRMPETIHVNAQGVWDDIFPLDVQARAVEDQVEMLCRVIDFPKIPRTRPPFPCMWLEARQDSKRNGALVRTFEIQDLDSFLNGSLGLASEIRERIRRDSPNVLVRADLWHEFEGSAWCSATCFYWLDAEGAFRSSARQVIKPDLKDDELHQKRIHTTKLLQGWLLHSFARMNCANVQLVPRGDGRERHRRDRKHSTIWHEIRVSDAPKMRSAAGGTSGGNGHEVRMHWVRGHYADYTKGAGLFGNPKLRAVFWMPAHRAGDEKLGEVIAGYRIEPKTQAGAA